MIYSLQSLSSFNGVIVGSAITGEALLVPEVPASSFSDFSDISSSDDRRHCEVPLSFSNMNQRDPFKRPSFDDSCAVNQSDLYPHSQPARRLTDRMLLHDRRQALLSSSQSRILFESDSWREWFLPQEWLTLAAYATATVWVGFAETVLSPLTPLLEEQTDSSPSRIALVTLGSSLGFVTASLSSGVALSSQSGCIRANKRHRLLTVAMWIGSAAMIFVKYSNNVIVESGLWCLMNMGCGVLEPSINAFVFELTAHDKKSKMKEHNHNDDILIAEQKGQSESQRIHDFISNLDDTIRLHSSEINLRRSTDPVFAAMVSQVMYGLFSIGTILAPLSIQWSVQSTDSYSPALWSAALFGLLSGVFLICVSPPSSSSSSSLSSSSDDHNKRVVSKKHNISRVIPSHNHSYGAVNSIDHRNIHSHVMIPRRRRSLLKIECGVPGAIGAMLILMSSFYGALMVAANVFVGDYTHRYLHFSRSFGRSLNTGYFTAQMIGRLVWIGPVRCLPVAINLGAVCILTCLSLGLFTLSPVWFGREDTSWQFQLSLIIGFSLPGFCKAPIIALTLQFIDTMDSSSTVWSSLTMAGWAVGTCSGTLIAGWLISNLGFVTFPYVLCVYSGIPLVIYAAVIAASIMYFNSPSSDDS